MPQYVNIHILAVHLQGIYVFYPIFVFHNGFVANNIFATFHVVYHPVSGKILLNHVNIAFFMRPANDKPATPGIHHQSLPGKPVKFLLGYKKSKHRSFEEICAAVDAEKKRIPSLTQGGYTQESGDEKQ